LGRYVFRQNGVSTLNKYLLIILLNIFVSNALGSERVTGTQIVIDPPTYLEPAKQFSGYVDEEYGTSIMIAEIPGPINEVMKGMNKKGFANKGVTLLSTEDIKLGNDSAKLMKLSQTAYELDFTKWMVLLGDDTKSIIIAASFQTELSSEVSDKLKKTILTSRWERGSKIDFFEGLTFKVDETKSLKIANKMGNALILTKDGLFPIENKKSPYAIIAASYSNTYEIKSRANYARERLMKSDGFTNIEVIDQSQTKVNNLNGEIILAKALDIKSNTWKYIHFSMLFNDDSYYIIQSIAELEEQKLIESEFQSLLASFVEV
jgi:hypothetical protein